MALCLPKPRCHQPAIFVPPPPLPAETSKRFSHPPSSHSARQTLQSPGSFWHHGLLLVETRSSWKTKLSFTAIPKKALVASPRQQPLLGRLFGSGSLRRSLSCLAPSLQTCGWQGRWSGHGSCIPTSCSAVAAMMQLFKFLRRGNMQPVPTAGARVAQLAQGLAEVAE